MGSAEARPSGRLLHIKCRETALYTVGIWRQDRYVWSRKFTCGWMFAPRDWSQSCKEWLQLAANKWMCHRCWHVYDRVSIRQGGDKVIKMTVMSKTCAEWHELKHLSLSPGSGWTGRLTHGSFSQRACRGFICVLDVQNSKVFWTFVMSVAFLRQHYHHHHIIIIMLQYCRLNV